MHFLKVVMSRRNRTKINKQKDAGQPVISFFCTVAKCRIMLTILQGGKKRNEIQLYRSARNCIGATWLSSRVKAMPGCGQLCFIYYISLCLHSLVHKPASNFL